MSFLHKHWGKIGLSLILLTIIILNLRPGYFILGNDNYSPELNPKLSIQRYLQNPAWRDYRILGIPSDSEQADIVRSLAFYLLSLIIPNWLISQFYVFIAFFVASFSMAYFARDITDQHLSEFNKELIFFFAGIFYFANLLTSWIFFSPLKVFLTVYAFLPFLLWRLHRFFHQGNYKNLLLLFLAVILVTNSGMVATSFIAETLVILLFIIHQIISSLNKTNLKTILFKALISLTLIFGTQLFWILPFIEYVKVNSLALKETYINRVLTPELIENEVKYNTPFNITRFYFAWIDTLNNDGSYQFKYRLWYGGSILGQSLGYVPAISAIIGTAYVIKKRKKHLIFFPLLLFGGWLIIKGTNPPFGQVFKFFQENIPLFKQVFRWQSSKLFPAVLIPISILGSLGVYFISRKGKITSFILLVFLTVSSLIYVYPYFRGDLISRRNFISIPKEYSNLKDFLKKYDTKSRIYLAPEANTLYFRSYSWGFFGSSFLNYLIPNPIIEKALTTGSLENEQAQKVIENAYYSENPAIFAQSLKLYNTPLVLLDKNAAKLENGYSYNWEVTTNVIEKNPFLQKIWASGNLSLYKIILENNLNLTKETIYQDHDWRLLNTLRLYTGNSQSYLTGEDIIGSIYPLALNYQEILPSDNSLIATTIYEGPQTTYLYTLKNTPDYLNTPTKIFYDNISKAVSLSAYYPEVFVNNVSYALQLPEMTFKLKENTKFITIDKDVVDLEGLNQKPSYFETNFQESVLQLKQWNNQPNIITLSNQFQDKYTYNIEKPSIVTVILKLSANLPTPLKICLYSKIRFSCLNRENTIYLGSQAKEVKITLPEVLDTYDILEIYLTLPEEDKEENKTTILIDKLELYLYNEYTPLQEKISEKFYDETPIKIPLAKGDKLSFVIPKIKGYNSYHLDGKNTLVPDVSHGKCDRVKIRSFIKKPYTDGLDFESYECFDQSLINFDSLTHSPLGLFYYQGKNLSGIPLILSLRNKRFEYKNYEDRLLYETDTNKFTLLGLPNEIRSYILELYSFGYGPNPSKNQIENLTFQFLPQPWLGIKLVPENQSPPSDVFTINQSFHQNWQSGNNTPVRLNGWEQGFIVKDNNNKKVEFLPNKLAFIGYLIDLFIIGGLLLYPIWKKVLSRKYN